MRAITINIENLERKWDIVEIFYYWIQVTTADVNLV